MIDLDMIILESHILAEIKTRPDIQYVCPNYGHSADPR